MRSNYTPREVRLLVEGWEEKALDKGVAPPQLYDLCRLIDIDRAIIRLGPKEYQAVLLCGQLGLDFRFAGDLLGCAGSTMLRRYQTALELLTADLNTGGL